VAESATLATAARAPEPATQPAAPAPELSEIIVRVSPASAQIVIDGVPVVGNPFSAHYLKDETHEIRALAIGYEPKTRKVSTSSDVVVEMNLERRPNASQTRALSAPASARIAQRTATLPAAPSTAAAAPSVLLPLEIDPAGGRTPRRPIDSRNPYESP
jgi:hypothetical protein